MRNLKKILALVLALVMSLSLMATAGATEFPDDDKISDTYRTAAEVLTQLNVFAGDQNGNFNPDQNITRAEVAAILYRIGTGDVGVENHKTYAPYNQFKDVQVEDWYAGYVTYCANAGWIKGRNTGNFDARDNVTGYEVLAMILRAVGYDKNNEFVGSNWQMSTASTARELGVLDNVAKDPSVQLSQPASREVVAELLFRASLVPQVTWNAATLSYRNDGETLGMKNFGLEDVSGVVVANEWANINDDDALVLADNTTQLRLADGTNYTINQPTDLEAVGQEYSAYVADSTDGSRTKRALTLELSNRNAVASNDGKSVNSGRNDQGFASISAVAAQEGISLNADTLYYSNYDLRFDEWQTTDIVIRYAIAKIAVDGYTNPAAEGSKIFGTNGQEIATVRANVNWQRYKNDVLNTDKYPGHSVEERNVRVNWDVNNSGDVEATDILKCYVFTISPKYEDANGRLTLDTVINDWDRDIMENIFYFADRLGTNNNDNNNYATQNYAYGEVYTGTTSMVDESDTLTWAQFQEKFFVNHDSESYNSCGNGTSLRVIDSDGDGVAEYVFRVTYGQDRAVTSYNDVLEFNALIPQLYAEVWEGGAETYAVGDVINFRIIDGKVTIWKAEVVTDTIKDKIFRNTTVVPANHDALGQSDILNCTVMDDDIMNMLDQTEYHMYLDQFGFIRTYELAQGSQYALVTEVYPTNDRNYNYVTTNNWIAEIKAGDADMDEYLISNPTGNPFISNYAWTSRINNYVNNNDINYLQPAVAHLGMIPANTALTKQFFGATAINPSNPDANGVWNRNVYPMVSAATAALQSPHANITSLHTAATDYGVFDYGNLTANPATHEASFTNVASYTLGEDTVALRTASQLATDRSGNQLYRIGSAAVSGIPAKYVYAYGTEAQLKDLWVRENTDPATGAVNDGTYTNANDWWNGEYSGSNANVVAKNGTKIYPIYAVDYVQLAKQDVSSTLRHYNIADSYSANFNTNSNIYVNAVVDTEFYVVTPTGVTYYENYSALPAIDAEYIRAMYAVATNTTANADGVDFWTANVIVIETATLNTAYESISLMFYNPWENSSSIRYVEGLNNQYTTYEAPDPDMTTVPNRVNGTGAGSGLWGNHSWTPQQYGFYGLTGTSYNAENDELSATTATRIPDAGNGEKYADYGIYAATIRRLTSEIYGSGYMDVDYGLGAGVAYDQAAADIAITNVPFYRITGTSAYTLRLAPASISNEVFVGDEIIIVRNRAGGIAYVVDLGTNNRVNNAHLKTAPAWLWSIYDTIITEQTTVAPAPADKTISFNLGLTGSEGIKIYTKDETTGAETLEGTWTAAAPSADITVSGDTDVVVLVIEPINGANVAAVVPNTAGNWVKVLQTADAATGKVTVKLVDNTIRRIAAPEDVLGTIYSATKVQEIMTAANNIASITDANVAQAAALLAELQEIQNNTVTSYDATGLATSTNTLAGVIASTPMTTVTSDSSAVKLPDPATVVGGTTSNTIEVEVKKGYTPAVNDTENYQIDEKGDQTGATAGYVIYTVAPEGSFTGNKTVIITATADSTTATLAKTGDYVTLPESTSVTCSAGEGTFTITVTEGYDSVSATVTKDAAPVAGAEVEFTKGATANGKTTYTGKITGLYEDATITITATQPLVLQVGVTSSDAQVTVGTSLYDVDSAKKATISFQVTENWMPAITKAADTATVGTPVKGTTANGKTTWTCEITNVTAATRVTIAANPIVTLAVSGEHITLDSTKAQITLTEGASSAASAITLDENYAPKTTVTGVTFTPGAAANGKVPYTVAVTGKTAPVTITITAEEIKKADVTFTANENATVKLDGAADAVTSPLEDQVVGSTVTFTVEAKTNYAIKAVKNNGTDVEGDDGSYTITVAEGGNTITVETVALVSVTLPSTSAGEYTVGTSTGLTGGKAQAGGTVTVVITPETGKVLTVKVGTTELEKNSEGAYTYTIPTDATAGSTITITVTAANA